MDQAMKKSAWAARISEDQAKKKSAWAAEISGDQAKKSARAAKIGGSNEEVDKGGRDRLKK